MSKWSDKFDGGFKAKTMVDKHSPDVICTDCPAPGIFTSTECEKCWMGKTHKMNNQKLAWYILDEIAVNHSNTCGGSPPPCGNKSFRHPWSCYICDRAIEAMKLLEKPTYDECRQLYEKRR